MPPAATERHAEIDAWIGTLMPGLQPIVRHVDGRIRETLPGLTYAIKWKRAFYGLPDLGWVIELAPYDVSVNAIFHGGADFDSPPPLGTADRTRYVKLTTPDDAASPGMQRWIEQAGRFPGWR
jgi:hypothetical protein